MKDENTVNDAVAWKRYDVTAGYSDIMSRQSVIILTYTGNFALFDLLCLDIFGDPRLREF